MAAKQEGFGAGDLCMGSGMHVPFPIDGRERKASKNPRKSIRERYASEADYVEAEAHVTQALVADKCCCRRLRSDHREVPARYRAAVTRLCVATESGLHLHGVKPLQQAHELLTFALAEQLGELALVIEHFLFEGPVDVFARRRQRDALSPAVFA